MGNSVNIIVELVVNKNTKIRWVSRWVGGLFMII